jgi:Glu-tRNA(Gln) amidotransferase subunit E-like FAD-binding protein
VVKSCEPIDFPQFGTLSEQKLTERAVKVAGWIWESDTDIPRDRLSVSRDCMTSIIDLVERRRVYFHVFHRIEMSEWNEATLYCFWIAKLQPFADVPPPNVKARQSNDVNATIAVRLLCRVANKLRKRNGKGDLEKINVSNLIHSFRFRDISKESMMALLEVLIEK